MSVLDYVMGQRSVDTSGGGGGDTGGMIITFDGDTGYSVQTWTEIKAVLEAGKPVYLDNGADLCAFHSADSYKSEDVSKINLYFGNNSLGVNWETGKLYFFD